MESSYCSSTVRRRAWINSSRHCSTVEEQEQLPSFLTPGSTLDDNVFSEECFSGKNENGLLHCGSEAGSETETPSVVSAVEGERFLSERGLARHKAFKECRRLSSSIHQQGLPQSLRLDHSVASHHFSSSWKSSVTEATQWFSEDAEETLCDLGFGWEEPQVAIRIPPRFLKFPSHAKGITFRLFLDSQLRRIREEDPSLSLASRFRQVQVLTEMANAFYSLYSHVSRTPLQKLASPVFNFNASIVERIERFRSSARHEPRSPVERLKDTVNKMCLYTSQRGSESTSPQPSPRAECTSPEVVDFLLDCRPAAEKKPNLGDLCGNNLTKDVTLGRDREQENIQTENKKMEDRTVGGYEVINEYQVKQTGRDPSIESLGTSCSHSSGKSWIRTDHQIPSCQIESDSKTAVHFKQTNDPDPIANVTDGLICSHTADPVPQASSCSRKDRSFSPISSEAGHDDTARLESHTLCLLMPISKHDGKMYRTKSDSTGEDISVQTSGLESDPRHDRSDPICRITVSRWDGESSNAPDSSPAAPHTDDAALVEMENQYLLPLRRRDQEYFSKNVKQVHSFEMEEVQSAGEEDFGHPETLKTTTSALLMKSAMVRGDSMQSDSSGYADEEVYPSPERQ